MGKTAELLKIFDNIIENTNHDSLAIKDWLDCIGEKSISIDWTAEDLKIYGSNEIYLKQIEYANKDQKNQWVVIADCHADPIIIDDSDGYIKFARHGQGKWVFIKIANNLRLFAKFLKIYVTLFYIEFLEKILDEDYEVRQDFLNRIKIETSSFLTDKEVQNILFVLLG